MTNPLKSVLIDGSLSSGEITFKLCPEYFQLQSGIWEIAIHSVSVNHPSTRDYIFNISSNLVLGFKYEFGKLKRFQVILNQFKINSQIGMEVISNKNPLWFLINNSTSEHFSIFINEWPTNPNPRPQDLANFFVGITVLFRRVI